MPDEAAHFAKRNSRGRWLIGCGIGQHLVNAHHQAVGGGHQRPLMAEAWMKALIAELKLGSIPWSEKGISSLMLT